MAKIKIIVDVPNEDCSKCIYYAHTSFERGYQMYEERYRCTLFKCDLDYKANRCVACKSCEVAND